MKSFYIAVLLTIAGSNAFAPAPSTTTRLAPLNAYVPDGMTLAQYNKIKAEDRRKVVGKDLARLGPRGFKSRSMQAWQEAYERGETGHSYAPFGYRQLLKEGKIKKQDVPYMVRGGSWDNADVRGARKLRWTSKDRDYAKGGYKKEQSASILGSGPGFNWTGETRPADKKAQQRLIPGLS